MILGIVLAFILLFNLCIFRVSSMCSRIEKKEEK